MCSSDLIFLELVSLSLNFSSFFITCSLIEMSALTFTASQNWRLACRFGCDCDMRRDPDHEQAYLHLSAHAVQGPKPQCPHEKVSNTQKLLLDCFETQDGCYMTLDPHHLALFQHSVVLPTEEELQAAAEQKAAEDKAAAAKKAAQEMVEVVRSLHCRPRS